MSHFLSPGPQELLTDATTGSAILWIAGLCERVTIVLESDGTTSGGAITIEEAYYAVPETPYAGTWSILGSAINASTFSGGAQVVVHVVNYSIWALRVRISSTITGGGTVTATAWAN